MFSKESPFSSKLNEALTKGLEDDMKEKQD